jgi:YfiH family protein
MSRPQVPIQWLFDDRPGLHCGLSSRRGGVSEPPFDSLNLGTSTPDRPEALAENRRRFYRASGLDRERVASMRQVHGARVVTVAGPGHVGEADGLVTASADLALLVSVADCLPVFLADLDGGVVGALHAGWRGIVAGVLEAGVEAAVAAGAAPGRLQVTVGPGIGGCCFEVGPEVAAHFPAESLRPAHGEHPHVDLAHAARQRLAARGIDQAAIRGPDACTRCQSDRFFSARSGEPTGRMVGFICRRPRSMAGPRAAPDR